MFPVHIHSENGPALPENGNYFVIAGNGTFFHKENNLLKGLIKVTAVPDLEEVTPYGEIKLPKIPFSLAYMVKQFFEEVWREHKSEAAVLLHYSYADGYYISAPKQKVSGASVKYDRDDRFSDSKGNQYICVGTIHSHCDFSAFHSGVDTADEADFDGIHLTFGHVNQDKFSIASSIALSNNRFKIDPKDHIEGLVVSEGTERIYSLPLDESIDESGIKEEIKGWMKNVEKEYTAVWSGHAKSYTGFWKKGEAADAYDDDSNDRHWWEGGSGSWSHGTFYPSSKTKTLEKEEWLYYNEDGKLLKNAPDAKEWTEVVNKDVLGLRIWKNNSNNKQIFGYSTHNVVENVGGPVV